MKGREAQERLKGKIDPELLRTLVEMCEDFRVQQEEIMTVAAMVDSTVNIVSQLTGIIENTQGAVDKLRKIRGTFDA